MSLDLTLLKLLKHRDNYEKYARAIPEGAIEAHTKVLLKDLGSFFKENSDCNLANVDDFASYFKLAHPKLKPESSAVLVGMIRAAAPDVPAEVAGGLVARLTSARAAIDMASALEQWNNGDEFDLMRTLRIIADRAPVGQNKMPIVEYDIDAMLRDEENDWGFSWRLNCMNQSMRPLRPGDFGIVAARVDQGKCLALGTKVIMADGSTKAVEDVQVGDVLAGPFRNNTVTGTTRGVSELYDVTYPWGESYRVNEGHKLSLQRSANEGKHKAGELRVMEVQDYSPPDPKNYRWKGWKAGVSLPEVTLPMDAYTLGLWLGDGTSAKPQFTSQDPELVQHMVQHYGMYTNVWDGITYDFYGTNMTADLRAAGVWRNKHIPKQYLQAGDEQRRALLAGLLDTDGFNTGQGYEFSQKDEGFMQDFVFLVRSLGIHCTYSREFKRAANTAHAGDWYCRARLGTEVYGTLPLKRRAHLDKEAAWVGKPKRNGNRHSITVTPAGVGEYAGFGLDGDHLFLLEDFTVTHNTTWFASELTHMAPQVDVLFPDQNRSIIYLNNEGVGKRIIQRCYQAALNATVTDLVELSKKGTIRADYLKALGGREVIRVLDVHDHPLSSLEDMVARMNPALVVVDMLDVVPFDGSASNGGTRTDQLLEAAYQRARFWAVKYDCAVIAASQLSAEADGNLYPPLASLANSKTGKPGAADWVAMLGASNDPLMRESRWVSLPKNKLHRSGFPKDPRSEVIFKGDTARVENPL